MLNRINSPRMLHYAYISKVIILHTCCILQLFRWPDLNVTVYLCIFMEISSVNTSSPSIIFALNRSCRKSNCVLTFFGKTYCRTHVIINFFFNSVVYCKQFKAKISAVSSNSFFMYFLWFLTKNSHYFPLQPSTVGFYKKITLYSPNFYTYCSLTLVLKFTA